MNYLLTNEEEIEEDEEDLEPCVCQYCGNALEPMLDNVGFDQFEGPTKMVFVGYKACDCGLEYDDDQDQLEITDEI